MAALNPFATQLRNRRVPMVLSVAIPYLSTILIVFLLVFPLIPFIFSQVQSLLTSLPVFLNESGKAFGFSIDAKQIQSIVANELNNIGRNAFAVTSAVFGGVFSVLTILIVSFYLMLYHDKFKHRVAELFHKDLHQKIYSTLTRIDFKLGAWLRGQLVLMVFIGVLTWLTLTALGVPYALPLAILAGILEVIPTLGPTISAIPAVIVAITISPSLGLIVALSYFVIQMIENNFLVPKIMEKAVGLNPVFVILGVMIGASLMGITGALLSIPFLSFLIVLFKSIADVESEKV